MDDLKQITVAIVLTLAIAGCGGSGGGGSGSSSSSGSGGGAPGRPAAPTVVYMWVADPSTDSDGDYFAGGPAVADAFCASAAVNQGITFATPVDTHWGILAFPTSEPRAFFSNAPVAQRPDGTTIVADYANFFDPSITITNPVYALGGSVHVWTGLGYNTGSYAGDSGACQGWTSDSSSDDAARGRINLTGVSRFDNNPGGCAALHGIYCVSFQN